MKIIKLLLLFSFGLVVESANVLQSGALVQLDTTKVENLIDKLLYNTSLPAGTDILHDFIIFDEIRMQVHAKIAQLLLQFVDMKDKHNFLSYFEKLLPLIKEITPPINEDERLLIELVNYLNSSTSKKHIDFTNPWDKINNTTYWLTQVATVPILNKAMRLIIKLLNKDSVTKMLAPNKTTWTPRDVDLASIITTKALYK